jgi:hypothetical protein
MSNTNINMTSHFHMNPEQHFAMPNKQVNLFDENGNPTKEAEIMTEYNRESARFNALTGGHKARDYNFKEKDVDDLKDFNNELEKDPRKIISLLAGRSAEVDSGLEHYQM